jgi:HNH endonuclease/AP2 domain
MTKHIMTAEEARQLFTYNEETGELHWTRDVRPRAKKGEVAGFICPADGYRRIGYKGSINLGHRVMWLFHMGRWPHKFLDHIDGNRANNRIENLREASRTDNNRNVAIQRNNTSGYKGVSLMRRDNVWVAQITVNRKNYFLGRFATPEEAHAAYCKAAKELHGEFANTG